jgi:hypothetical protein
VGFFDGAGVVGTLAGAAVTGAAETGAFVGFFDQVVYK